MTTFGWYIRGRTFGVDNRDLDRFCCNWDIQLRNTPRVIRKPKPVDVHSLYSGGLNMCMDTYDLECYEVLIPKDNFHALAEIDKKLDKVITKSRSDEDYIKHVKRMEMIEIKARNNNPAVKKAWENYTTLMNLVYHEYADRY